MGKQLPLFDGDPAANAALDRALAKMRLERTARDASRLRKAEHHRSVSAPCPSCGTCVTIRVS